MNRKVESGKRIISQQWHNHYKGALFIPIHKPNHYRAWTLERINEKFLTGSYGNVYLIMISSEGCVTPALSRLDTRCLHMCHACHAAPGSLRPPHDVTSVTWQYDAHWERTRVVNTSQVNLPCLRTPVLIPAPKTPVQPDMDHCAMSQWPHVSPLQCPVSTSSVGWMSAASETETLVLIDTILVFLS